MWRSWRWIRAAGASSSPRCSITFLFSGALGCLISVANIVSAVVLQRSVCVCVCVASLQRQPKVFSAGLDILEMYGKSPEHCGAFWKTVQEMWLKLYGSNMITIAAINVRARRHLTLQPVSVSRSQPVAGHKHDSRKH